jgi:hypothetical protein
LKIIRASLPSRELLGQAWMFKQEGRRADHYSLLFYSKATLSLCIYPAKIEPSQ